MCSLSWLLSRRSSPTATYAHARDPTLAAPHARGPLAKNCSSSCLSSLHLLRSWSLRQTRGGSKANIHESPLRVRRVDFVTLPRRLLHPWHRTSSASRDPSGTGHIQTRWLIR